MSDEIKLTPLKSSNIEGAHYDAATRTMTIKFKSGGTYKYGGVVQQTYDDLISAESPGKYFHKTIKSGDYKWHRQDD
jgi:hypothetical protein